MRSAPDGIVPDAKDWTWVLERPCPDCGFDPADQALSDLPRAFHDTAMAWSDALERSDVAERPSPDVWSPLEYACHVRDVHELFAQRVRLMLDEDAPTFANWDQDATAIECDYGSQDPAVVVVELIEAAGHVAGIYASVSDATSSRRGLRSNGDAFTVETLGKYHLHDIVHHLHDVGAGGRGRVNETVRAYDLDAAAYVVGTTRMPDSVRSDIEEFVARLGSGARVLEIGSGGGRDARLMEELGLSVRRTDITPAFVTLLRGQGLDADLLDPLVDDLSSPSGEYDGVWANASLLHVDRVDLPIVLARLADVTRAGGLLRVSLKEGDGDGWSTHGSISSPRHFAYWRADALRDAIAATGWSDVDIRSGIDGKRSESWLELTAVRS